MQVTQIVICAFILILMLICSGCTTTKNPATNVNATVSATTSPTLNNNENTPITTEVSTPYVGLTSKDVNLHFMDLAFGGGNIYLERMPAPALQAPPVSISVSNGNADDIDAVKEFVVEFNDLSASTKLSENVKESITGEIQIKFIPPEGFNAIELASKEGSAPTISWLNKEFKKDGVTYAKVKDNRIYINSDLRGAERKHYIFLGLLFELGFKGSSMTYPDSIFFDQGNNVTSFSTLDRKAIQIMYGLGLWKGMTVDDVKKRVLIASS